jgi:hypothetical protein
MVKLVVLAGTNRIQSAIQLQILVGCNACIYTRIRTVSVRKARKALFLQAPSGRKLGTD